MKLNLKLKLLFLVSLAIFIPISVSSYLYYNSLMVEYKRDAYISTTNDYKIIDSEIKDLADNLKNLSNQIKDDKNIQSILNLISNYEDRDNYSKIIFDEEKKKLLYIVSQQLKSKQNISFGIFDKNGDAIVLNRIKDGNRVNGFISYNGKANFIDIKTGTILKMPFYRKATLDSTDKLHILLDKYGFALVYLQKIYIDGKFIGFIKIKELFTQSNIDQFIQNLHNKFSFLSRDLMVGDFFDVDKQFIFKNGSIHTDKHTISEMAENIKYSFHIHYIDTILNDEKLYLISAYDKKLLTSKINSLRDNLFLSILISIILSFFISILFLQKTILNPIAKLIDGINNLKNKNYKLIELKSDDEFSVIANQFNRLTNTLKDSF
ncbi:MAG: hypothetical protein U9R16_00950, partial [Campylobacterota bacterium]|nr:hypothetical protein [Campylobacterota bacterium]